MQTDTRKPSFTSFASPFNVIILTIGIVFTALLGWQYFKLDQISKSLTNQSMAFKDEAEFNAAVAKAFNKGGFKPEVQHLLPSKVRRCHHLVRPRHTSSSSLKSASPLPA